MAQPNPEIHRLLIAGSRGTSPQMIQYAHICVENAIHHGMQIVVGDNPNGGDNAVVEACNAQGYDNIVVVGIAGIPRNGGVIGGQYIQMGASYTERDRIMVDSIHQGRMMFIWNGKSPGTKRGFEYARKSKPDIDSHLMDFSATI